MKAGSYVTNLRKKSQKSLDRLSSWRAFFSTTYFAGNCLIIFLENIINVVVLQSYYLKFKTTGKKSEYFFSNHVSGIFFFFQSLVSFYPKYSGFIFFKQGNEKVPYFN